MLSAHPLTGCAESASVRPRSPVMDTQDRDRHVRTYRGFVQLLLLSAVHAIVILTLLAWPYG